MTNISTNQTPTPGPILRPKTRLMYQEFVLLRDILEELQESEPLDRPEKAVLNKLNKIITHMEGVYQARTQGLGAGQ